uniref:Uncharacterized protein n=1 Tax=Arundo donax TaxID=35708 RepID=A0A0A9CGB1_ARUDO
MVVEVLAPVVAIPKSCFVVNASNYGNYARYGGGGASLPVLEVEGGSDEVVREVVAICNILDP